MHDPMTLAHRIPNPIPRISKNKHLGHGNHKDKRWGWQVRFKPFSKHNYFSPFVYIAGYELYFDSLVDIWHTDPRGDAGPACHGRKHWKWHIQHMSIKWVFIQRFVKRHITRCAWCNGKSDKKLGMVHFSNGRVVFHEKCYSEHDRMIHDHNPQGCYRCSGSASFEYNRQLRRGSSRQIAKSLFGTLRRRTEARKRIELEAEDEDDDY